MILNRQHSSLFVRVLREKKPFICALCIMVFILCLVISIPTVSWSAGQVDATQVTGSQLGMNNTIRLARATWDTGWFQTEIFRLLLQELGYAVAEPRTHENKDFYRLAARGEIDFWANGWFPLHNSFIGKRGIQEKVHALGFEVKAGALQGYLVDKKTAAALKIRSLDDLKKPEIARYFDIDGNGKADLIGCNEGWGCAPVIEHHLDAYELRATVEHIQADYGPLMAETVARFNRGQPVLFYTWTPNWTIGTLIPDRDVVWIEVPFPSLPEGGKGHEHQTYISGVPGCRNDPCSMGFPPNDIRVVANNDFILNHPDVKHLLEVVRIPLDDISAQNAKMIDGEDEDEDIRRHAKEWSRANREKIDQWLTASRAIQTVHKPAIVPQEALPPQKKPKVLRVATKRFEPFVLYQDKQYTGFSIELWGKIASDLGWQYELYGVNTIAKLLDEVARGSADVAIAGISITSKREQHLDFSHAFYETGLQIMVPAGSDSLLGEVVSKVFSVILSRELLYGVGIFFIVLIIVSHIIWILERRSNPEFSRHYPQGIWESIWWAVVTVTTVGYGDKTPKGTIGRLFGLFWILSGYFVFAYFTASVTTTATVQELYGTINGPQDLFGKKVATVERSTAAEYLTNQGISAEHVKDVDHAYVMLESGKTDAIVYDAPVLQHYASKGGRGKVKVVGLIFQEQNYGIALQVQSAYREKINIALLKLMESGVYKEIQDKWFGDHHTHRGKSTL